MLILPDTVNQWHCISEHVVPLVLDVNSEDLGRVTYRDYGSIQVILTQGAGTGSLYVPEEVNDTKALMPSEAIYDVIDIHGHKTILEQYEYMPMSLAVSVSKDTVLTVEGTDRDSVIEFVEGVLSLWSNTE